MTQNEQSAAPAAEWEMDDEASTATMRVETLNGVERRTNVEVAPASPAEQPA